MKIVLASALLLPLACAWTQQQPSAAASRRAFFDQAAKIAVPLVIAAPAAFADDEAPAAVAEATPASSDAAPVATEAVLEAAEPEAPPPAAMDGENEFIARLRAQSEANRDKYKRLAESNDKLSVRQFRSQYDRPSYVGVYHPDSEPDKLHVTMLLKSELDDGLSAGKITKTYQSKVDKKSGEISDDYSRPIFVFVN